MPPRFSLSIIITASLLLLLVIYKSHELIGFIYGPSSQLFATKQQIIQSNLLSRIFSESESTTTATTASSWMMARIASTAEQIYNPHYELAYQHEHDSMTCVLRDAGVFTAMIAVLRACNFFAADDNTTTTTTKSLRRWHRYHYLFMAGALFILPGMIGQLLLSKTIPIEILLLNRFNNSNTDMSLSGIVEGIMYVGYCSLKSVLGWGCQEGGDGMYPSSAVYELKVVGVALAFVAFFLGE
mmetsp:Transcript_28621/g.57609  ORF Transcript_28621/g.57609 Transcript_28621/m.57609 type:complete len:241 (-) Transcript_28621:40-762(-)